MRNGAIVVAANFRGPHIVKAIIPGRRDLNFDIDRAWAAARFAGVDGSAYFVGGLGMTALTFNAGKPPG